ncbi:hypothetical protein CRUP_013764, partial [Coryphaenoides rupestris]
LRAFRFGTQPGGRGGGVATAGGVSYSTPLRRDPRKVTRVLTATCETAEDAGPGDPDPRVPRTRRSRPQRTQDQRTQDQVIQTQEDPDPGDPDPKRTQDQVIQTQEDPGPGDPDPKRTQDQFFSHVKVEHLAAGLSGGVVSTLILHPLDLVKVRFAVSDGLDLRPKYNGIMHCIRSVWLQEGLRGLYQGVTPNIWGAGASWGLYFFL